MITYNTENFRDVYKEMLPLFEAHYHEIAMYTDKIKLKPDFDRYEALDEMGMLHTVVVREDEKIVGYFITFLQPHIHYSDDVFGINDVLYIDPAYRGKMLGVKMFKYAEKELKKLGVSVLLIHTKTYADFEPLLTRLGFKHIENQYSKFIGE